MPDLFNKINHAYKIIHPFISVTPTEYSPLLSKIMGCQLYLKCEHQQRTGSFKFRGAMNKLLTLNEKQRRQGVITASTGNHGHAMALAGKLTSTNIIVYAPINASPIKLDAIRSYACQMVMVKGDALQTEIAARRQANQESKIFVSPYNDYDVIAGQGSIGLELAQSCPNLDAVFVAVGGGGMISGIGSVFKSLSPKTQLIGCWSQNAASMYHCIKNKCIIEVKENETLSDGTSGGIESDAITFPLCQTLIDRHVLVNEYEIKEAMRLLAETEHWMIEGAAGVALASFVRLANEYQGKAVAVVLCGRNITLDRYIQAISKSKIK